VQRLDELASEALGADGVQMEPGVPMEICRKLTRGDRRENRHARAVARSGGPGCEHIRFRTVTHSSAALGDQLFERRLITREQLAIAIEHQPTSGRRIGLVLIGSRSSSSGTRRKRPCFRPRVGRG
jgi:hypothetical protein